MNILKLVQTRIPVKNFAPKKPPIQHIFDLLETAILAPAPGNLQPLSFIIVEQEKTKTKLAHASQQPYIQNAPYIIVVCSDPDQHERMFDTRAQRYVTQYTGAAIQNILLTATEKKLSTYWVRACNEDQTKEILDIPQKITVQAMILVGYKGKTEIIRKTRKQTLNKRVFFHTWKNEQYEKLPKPPTTTD